MIGNLFDIPSVIQVKERLCVRAMDTNALGKNLKPLFKQVRLELINKTRTDYYLTIMETKLKV